MSKNRWAHRLVCRSRLGPFDIARLEGAQAFKDGHPPTNPHTRGDAYWEGWGYGFWGEFWHWKYEAKKARRLGDYTAWPVLPPWRAKRRKKP